MSEGTLIDRRYLLGRRLGAGAFGAVHLAEQRALGITLRQVALKLFDAEKLELPVEDLLHDALELIALVEACPDPVTRDLFVTCLDAGLEKNGGARPYVAMELVAGDLDARIAGSPLPVRTALDYARQIAKAVAFMHERGHLHRDLKPANILLTSEGRVKVGDFGLAVATDALLRAAPLAGTVVYQPPEGLTFGECTRASDVYSIGLICYEMLTGSLPYPDVPVRGGEVDVGALVELKMVPPEPPSRVRNLELREYPEFEEVVLSALDTQGSRYRDAGRLLEALEAAAEQRLGPARRSATPWERIAEQLDQTRAALRRDDLDRAVKLVAAASAANAQLPDAQMVAEVYPLQVDIALRQGRDADAQRLSLEGIRRRQCRVTYEAAARAHDGLPLGDAYARNAREATR